MIKTGVVFKFISSLIFYLVSGQVLRASLHLKAQHMLYLMETLHDVPVNMEVHVEFTKS